MKHLLYITYWTSPSQKVIIFPPKTSSPSPSQNVIIFPQNVHCRQLTGSPTRAPFTATWPRALLTFPPRDREELDNTKITSEIRCGKPTRTGSLKVFSGKSWYECSQTGEIVISIVWLSPQLDMFTILWGSSHIVMDAYFPQCDDYTTWRITIFGIMEGVIRLGIIIVTPKRSKQIEKGCVTKWNLQTSIFLGMRYHKLYHLYSSSKALFCRLLQVSKSLWLARRFFTAESSKRNRNTEAGQFNN